MHHSDPRTAPSTPPQTLTTAILVYGLRDFTVAVQWESPASDGGVGIDNYTLIGAGITISLTVLPRPLKATLNLLYNNTHVVSITASNCAGESTSSLITTHEGNIIEYCTVSGSSIVVYVIVGCGPPSHPPRGSLGDFTTSPVGAVVAFQCNPGMVPSQQMMSVCTNGTWTPDPAELLCIGNQYGIHVIPSRCL